MIQSEKVYCILIDGISLNLCVIMFVFPLHSKVISQGEEQDGQNCTNGIQPSHSAISNHIHSFIKNFCIVTVI